MILNVLQKVVLDKAAEVLTGSMNFLKNLNKLTKKILYCIIL